MTRFDQAAFSFTGTGTIAEAFGRHTIRITAEQTGGNLGCFEAEVPPGEGPPPHIHEKEDEFFLVQEGRFGFWCNGAHVELVPGGVIVVPRGAVHRFQNVGPTMGRLMVIVTPGGFEGFFPAIATVHPMSQEAVHSIAECFNMRFVMAEETKAA